MLSWLLGILKDPEKRAILSWFGGVVVIVVGGVWTVVTIVVEHDDARKQAIVHIITIFLVFATAAYFATSYFVFRTPLAKMREAIDAASAPLGSTTAGAQRAVAGIEHAERLSRSAGLGVAVLLLLAIGFNFLSYLPVVASIIPDAFPPRMVNAFLLALALGIFACRVTATVEIGRAKYLLEARNKIIASISEGRVSDATVVQHARGERDEHRYRQNLLAVFRLKYFELQGANIFRDLSWNLEPGINVLLGRNGFGKSFLLRLLAGMVSYDNDRLAKLLSHPDDDQRLVVHLLRNDDPVTIERGMVSFDEAVGKIPLLAIPDSRFLNRARNSISAEGDDYANLARYGAHHFLYELPYDTTIQTVLAQMCIEALKGGHFRKGPTSPQLDLVSDVIRELTGERFRFDRIEPIGSARFSIQVETDSSPGRPITIQQASQGTLSVVAIFGLIYQYLQAVHPSAAESDLCKQHGIVIIDEIDAHLHPAWQRKIAHLLRKHFPNIQFILTAHGPLVVAGCGHGEVAVLRRENSDLKIVDYQRDFVGASPQDIYQDVFEIEDRDVRFLELQANLPRLHDLNQELRLAKAEKSQNPTLIGSLEETINSIERTRKEQETKLAYEALERENAQLRRQLDALRNQKRPETE
jgi:energy-coupling factor transporter ATP-binding protein EcfA2